MPADPDDSLSVFMRTNPMPPAAPPQRVWRRRALTLALLLAVWLGAQYWQARDVPRGPAPAFSLPAVSVQPGQQLSLAQWQAAHPGRPVALNFWSESCPICKLQQSNVSRVGEDWPVLTVALQSGDVAAVRQALGRRGLDWPTVVDARGELTRRYGIGAVPAFVVIDASGQVRSASVGYTSELGMRARLWWAALRV